MSFRCLSVNWYTGFLKSVFCKTKRETRIKRLRIVSILWWPMGIYRTNTVKHKLLAAQWSRERVSTIVGIPLTYTHFLNTVKLWITHLLECIHLSRYLTRYLYCRYKYPTTKIHNLNCSPYWGNYLYMYRYYLETYSLFKIKSNENNKRINVG